MDLWIYFNFIVAALAAWVNFRRMKPMNLRYGLRMAGFVLSTYVAVIYLLAIIGIIPDFDVRLWLRWFQGVLMLYFIAEARNG